MSQAVNQLSKSYNFTLAREVANLGTAKHPFQLQRLRHARGEIPKRIRALQVTLTPHPAPLQTAASTPWGRIVAHPGIILPAQLFAFILNCVPSICRILIALAVRGNAYATMVVVCFIYSEESPGQ
jgi:hypothetical protein